MSAVDAPDPLLELDVESKNPKNLNQAFEDGSKDSQDEKGGVVVVHDSDLGMLPSVLWSS